VEGTDHWKIEVRREVDRPCHGRAVRPMLTRGGGVVTTAGVDALRLRLCCVCLHVVGSVRVAV
jgi:hypothetical protein